MKKTSKPSDKKLPLDKQSIRPLTPTDGTDVVGGRANDTTTDAPCTKASGCGGPGASLEC